MSAPETTPEEITSRAQRLGWILSDGDVAKLIHGVARNKGLGEVVRSYLRPEVEPATTFAAAQQEP
jgi:hypothetical protein